MNASYDCWRRLDMERYWCPHSEEFTGCDALLSALDGGFDIDRTVLHFSYPLRSYCVTHVYVFRLCCSLSTRYMKVIQNPVVLRLIQERDLEIVHIEHPDQCPVSEFFQALKRQES